MCIDVARMSKAGLKDLDLGVKPWPWGYPKTLDGFFHGKSESKMDEDIWGTPMTSETPV